MRKRITEIALSWCILLILCGGVFVAMRVGDGDLDESMRIAVGSIAIWVGLFVSPVLDNALRLRSGFEQFCNHSILITIGMVWFYVVWQVFDIKTSVFISFIILCLISAIALSRQP